MNAHRIDLQLPQMEGRRPQFLLVHIPSRSTWKPDPNIMYRHKRMRTCAMSSGKFRCAGLSRLVPTALPGAGRWR
jgi:hypothetical protein